jgi:PAS domain S-box-containing protein
LIFESALTDHALLNHRHAVLLFGPDGKNIMVNELAAVDCEANSLDRTTAERFLQGIGPYSLDKHSRGVAALQQGQVTFIICLPLPQKKYMTVDASLIEGLDGKYLLFTLADVTPIKELEILQEKLLAIKRAEKALRESNARYNELVRRIPVGVFTLRIRADGSGVFEYGSPQLCQIWDLDEDALLRDANLAFAMAHPEDRDSLMRTIQEVAVSLKPFRWEGRLVVRKETRWVRIESDPTPLRGGESLWNGVISDITERKGGEERLKSAFDEIKKLKEQLEAENIYLREQVTLKDGPEGIVGVSNPLKYVLHRIQQVAHSKTTVLLTGETGTGKGLFAHFLHEESDRRDKPFVNVNCAGLPPNLIESELFGREKGAFTGSTERQIGRFELANGGTIFLDEIGEVPIELQAKLLKVIEDGEFERLGSPRPVKVDVRIIASTHRNLEEEIEKGQFRKDLF